jgi:predicted RNA-binding protein with PUA-like domain
MSDVSQIAYWLLKSEPDVFSYSDLERVKLEPWTGVRNYQARNFLRQMKVGDLAFFYHSSTKIPGIAGICQIATAPAPDTLQFDETSDYFDAKSTLENPRWTMVQVAPLQPLEISLTQLRELNGLEGLALLKKGSRLSVISVSPLEWQVICNAARVL